MNKKKLSYCLCSTSVTLALLLSVANAWGLQKQWKNFSTAEGLPNSAVRAIALEGDLYVWIGTDKSWQVDRTINDDRKNIIVNTDLSYDGAWEYSKYYGVFLLTCTLSHLHTCSFSHLLTFTLSHPLLFN